MHSLSIDENVKPESDELEKETENDLPTSQCRPMMLSQSGKFIPKFMAKKKIADCVVKIERAPNLAESDNCGVPLSETEIGLKSQTLGTGSVADEVVLVVATDTDTDNVEPVLVECMVGLEASKHCASDSEQLSSPNKASTESIGSNTQGLPVDTTLQVNDIAVSDHSKDDCCEGRTSTAENDNSTLNGDVLGEMKHSANVDQRDISDVAKPLSSLSINDVSSEAAACTQAAETAPVADDDCTEEPRDLQIAEHENIQPSVDTDEVSGGGTAVSNVDSTAATEQSELIVQDASKHIDSVVAEVGVSVSPMPVAVPDNAEARPDVEYSDDNGIKFATEDSTENNDGNTLHDAVGKSDVSTADGEMVANNKTEVGQFDALPVNGDAAEDSEAGTGDNVEVGAVSEAREFVSGSSEPAMFDDFLDITDSQLCQLDDISR